MMAKEKNCEVCGEIHTKRGKTCGKRECINVLCIPNEEMKKRISDTLKKGFIRINQNIVCSDCGIIYTTKNVVKDNFGIKALKERVIGYCPECRSIRSKTKKFSPATLLSLSESSRKRALENNCMKNPETAKKVGNTIRTKIANGELLYIKGPEHHLFKGTRSLSKGLRDALYNRWSYWILYRANFQCARCGGKDGVLHVHHRYPLRYIVSYLMNKYNITKDEEKSLKFDYGKFSMVVEEGIQLHSFRSGVCLCKRCHGIVDSKYRGNNKEVKCEDKKCEEGIVS